MKYILFSLLKNNAFNAITLLLIFSCSKPSPEYYYELSPTLESERVNKWKEEQLKERENISVFHNFKFNDEIQKSEIKFIHRVVPDLQKNYITNHYDHGNGLAVADVNGDQLIDIFFLNQSGGNELWLNQGSGKFKRSHQDDIMQLKKSVSVSAAFGDYNNDGYSDLAVTTVRDGVFLFQNDGKGSFIDRTHLIQPNYNRHSSGIFFLDYNLDGDLDLFVTNTGVYTQNKKWGKDLCYIGIDNSFDGHLFPERTEPSVLYENEKGKRFNDVSLKTKLFEPNWNGDGTFITLGKDLYPQIYLTNMQGSDSFWVLKNKSNFQNKISTYFSKSSWGTMGAVFFDFNNDGHFDLYTTDMHTDMFPPYPKSIQEQKRKLNTVDNIDKELLSVILDKKSAFFGNLFFINQGNGSFIEASDNLNLENYWPWGSSAEDINADGYIDLFVTSGMNYTTDYGINWFYLNDKAKKFANAEFLVGIEPRKEMLTPWFLLDCRSKDRDHKLCAKYSGQLQVMAPKGSRAAAVFDIENDGDLDIVTNEFNSAPQVLISNLTSTKKISYIKIQLIGKRSNTHGLGAKVEVRSSSLKQIKYHNGKSGYLSQSVLPLYFGLDSNNTIESIRVTWPSGIVDNITKEIPLNQLVMIKEGEGIKK